MNKRTLVALALTAFIAAGMTWLVSLHMLGGPVSDDAVEQRTLSSTLLDEQRQYRVHLPASYGRSANRRYPVIYVLDGASQDAHTAASAGLMARIGVMPEAIVVGIPNTDNEGRQRDYTPPGMRQDGDDKDSPAGRADAFLGFLRNELLPAVDKDYRTSPSRTLAGNSRGGLFVVYALATDPGLFEAYIANSPALWRDDGEMIDRFDRFLQANPALKSKLFLSLGSDENDKMKRAFQRTIGSLETRAPSGLQWRHQFTPGATHGNNAPLATPVALRWVFDPQWKPADTAGDPASP